jgi:drug/metabolite transporter (DMT)-like permease
VPVGLRVHVALLFVQLAFASGALVGRIAFAEEGIDPTALAFVRVLAAAVAFAIVDRATRRADREPLPKLPMIGLAILGVVVNQAFFLHGLKRGTATSAALLCATIPVFTAALGIFAGVERPRVRTWIGLVLASVGVVTLTGVRDISVGNLLVTINSLSYAAYLVLVGKHIRRYGALRVVAAVFLWGAIVLALPGIPQLVLHAPAWSVRGWSLVAWFVLVPTIFAYLTNAWALGKATPSIVAAYVYLQPIFVLVVAGRMLGEKLDARTMFAGAAILFGLAIVMTKTSQPEA